MVRGSKVFVPGDVPESNASSYPEPFREGQRKRYNRRLGDHARLKSYGVNLIRILPGGQSSARHAHSKQDEFVPILPSLGLVADHFKAGGEHVAIRSDQCLIGLLAMGHLLHQANHTQDSVWVLPHKLHGPIGVCRRLAGLEILGDKLGVSLQLTIGGHGGTAFFLNLNRR